jgi:CMP-N-acetylneuraminic acid synthetase/spore coat polysaccharide biosynthesis predicted glycosyltransferase SpsG
VPQISNDAALLAIVPARGNSQGVPRKNMRTVAGVPLVAHTLRAVAEAGVAGRLLLSSEDPEILRWARLHGYEALPRPAELAEPDTTISEVAAHIAEELDWKGDVAIFQPTAPLLSPDTIRTALERFRSSNADSLASCTRETHLFWLDEQDDLARPTPLFSERVNRQTARHRVLRETGGIQLVRAGVLRGDGQIVTAKHELYEIDADEGLDIDTLDDLMAARTRMERGTVVFRLSANRTVGTGHLHHCLQIADELADHRVRFLLRDCDPFVAETLSRSAYAHRVETDLAADLRELAPSGPRLVVNDVLDTTEVEVLVEREAGFKVVNVEDLGPGVKFADWVVNALYPVQADVPGGVGTGAEYATLRSEFLALPSKTIRPEGERVLITFGGTDPGCLAQRCARLLLADGGPEIRVVSGPGADADDMPDGVTVVRGPLSMAEEMMNADVVVTSAGRTVYEAAATGTPVVVLGANAREATHAHLGYEHGVLFLGIGSLVADEEITGTVTRVLADATLRDELSRRLRSSIDGRGAARIAHRIRSLLADL